MLCVLCQYIKSNDQNIDFGFQFLQHLGDSLMVEEEHSRRIIIKVKSLLSNSMMLVTVLVQRKAVLIQNTQVIAEGTVGVMRRSVRIMRHRHQIEIKR